MHYAISSMHIVLRIQYINVDQSLWVSMYMYAHAYIHTHRHTHSINEWVSQSYFFLDCPLASTYYSRHNRQPSATIRRPTIELHTVDSLVDTAAKKRGIYEINITVNL